MTRKLKSIGLLLAGALIIITTAGISADDMRRIEETDEIISRALFENGYAATAGVNSIPPPQGCTDC